jgi:hypothetical protein
MSLLGRLQEGDPTAILFFAWTSQKRKRKNNNKRVLDLYYHINVFLVVYSTRGEKRNSFGELCGTILNTRTRFDITATRQSLQYPSSRAYI